MRYVSRTDFEKCMDKWLLRAETETVVVTVDGKPQYVLMSVPTYQSYGGKIGT